MSEADLHVLVERVNKLEKQNRRMRGGLVALAVVLCGAVAIAATEPVPQVIKAHEFQVVDKAGHARAGLGLDEDGPFLRMRDSAGTPRLGMSIFKGNPGLALADSSGNARMALNLADDIPGILLRDKAGKATAQMHMVMDSPTVSFSDRAGTKRMDLSIGENGPALNLFDSAGKSRAILGTSSIQMTTTGEKRRRAESSLVLFDKDSAVIFRAP